MKHAVVINLDGQHSVWPDARRLPPGWRRQGFTGSSDECLARIAEIWTDLRPRPAGDGTGA
jgi:MbtH protein